MDGIIYELSWEAWLAWAFIMWSIGLLTGLVLATPRNARSHRPSRTTSALSNPKGNEEGE